MKVPKLPVITLATATLFSTAAIAGSSAYMSESNQSQNTSHRELLFFKSKKKKKNKKNDASQASSDTTTCTYGTLTGSGSEVSNGLFKVIHKDGDFYYEIPKTLLGRDMLVVNKLVRVP